MLCMHVCMHARSSIALKNRIGIGKACRCVTHFVAVPSPAQAAVVTVLATLLLGLGPYLGGAALFAKQKKLQAPVTS